MHDTFGNSFLHTGYSCLLPVLIRQWRALWSRTPGTTDPLAPFGIVTLAASGSEGGSDLGSMRLAQTAGFGVVPNAAMPSTFLAQALDLDDPFSNTTCYYAMCCPYRASAAPSRLHPRANKRNELSPARTGAYLIFARFFSHPRLPTHPPTPFPFCRF